MTDERTDFSNTVIANASFVGHDLRGGSFRAAILRGADFRGADLRNVDFEGADLREVNFRDADLRGARLQGTFLAAANFADADLRGASLNWSVLKDATFEGAQLEQANFHQVAYLVGAQLEQSYDWERIAHTVSGIEHLLNDDLTWSVHRARALDVESDAMRAIGAMFDDAHRRRISIPVTTDFGR